MTERRNFLKASALAIPAVLRGAADAKPIKVGLVGCGGRGSGAAAQAMKADDYSELVAVADIDQSRINDCLERLKRVAGPKIKVTADNQFLGLDAYKKVIQSGADVIILATPPGFRPHHLRACIDAGKHVFCEKPVAVDGPGIRSVLETAKLAKEKNVCLVSGFCWRRSNYIQATFEQVHNGALGDLVAYYATYYTSPVKPMPAASTRPASAGGVIIRPPTARSPTMGRASLSAPLSLSFSARRAVRAWAASNNDTRGSAPGWVDQCEQ